MTTEQKIIKNKSELLKLATMVGNVSKECKIMVYSRDSLYRFKEAVLTGWRVCSSGNIAQEADHQKQDRSAY
jgi:hypothetical protein